jgi:hypothetical protein
MTGAMRWLTSGVAGVVGLVAGMLLLLTAGLVAVQAPALSPPAAPQDWDVTLEITNAYMGTLLQQQGGNKPIELRDPKAVFSKDGTVTITGSVAPGGISLPSSIAIPAEIVLRPGSVGGKFTVEIVRTQLGQIAIPNGLGRLLEGPINAQITNATQGRPFQITSIDVNDGYMLVRVRVEAQ